MKMDTRDPRAFIQATFADMAPAVPGSDGVIAKGKRVRLRENLVRTGVGLVVGIGVLAPFIALLGIGDTPSKVQTASETSTLSSDGISVDVGRQWGGSFFEVPGFSRDVLIVSNLPLPSTVSDSAAEVRVPLDSGEDFAVWMVEFVSLCPPCDEFVPVDDLPRVGTDALTGYDVASDSLPRIEPIPGHASTRMLFTTEGRFFDLRVEFGSQQPTDAALAEVNAILASIRVDPPSGQGDAPSCSDPSGFLNSSCPSHEWLTSVLRAGGLEVTGDTGTALSAANAGVTVNAWIADTEAALEDYSVWGEVQGTPVAKLGEDTIFWNAAGGRQVWIRTHSPGGGLSAETVERIVEESQG
jgi:hypothetical protein